MNMKNTKANDVRQNIIAIVSRITRMDQSGIGDDVLIREELGIDSLMAIEIVANIEKFYNVAIDESILLGVETVGDFIEIIHTVVLEKDIS
ncbi:MAG: acyl carrier protein [Spirochaetes bacterium]|nr:acyl carrier protein [Spirochaetota bacterium]